MALEYHQEGIEYYVYLIQEYLYSDFFPNTDKIESVSLSLEQILEIMNTKSFKDFFVQREKDFTLAAAFFGNMSYSLEDEGFGKTLEIDTGKYECMTALDDFNLTDVYIFTKYAEPVFFKPEYPLQKGEVSSLKTVSHDKLVIETPFLIYSAKKVSKRDYLTRKPFIKGNINVFDSIFYFNNLNLDRMRLLVLYALRSDKNIATGMITNVYDSRMKNKIKAIDEEIDRIESIIGTELSVEEFEQEGTIAKLIYKI